MFRSLYLPEHTLTSANPFLPEGEGDGAEGGGGATDPAPSADPPVEPAAGTDWEKHSKTWESRAHADKARADRAEAELAKARKASQTAEEKALDAARDEGRKAALAEVVVERTTDLLEAVLGSSRRGLSDTARKALVGRINPASFVDADGKPDRKAITEWADQVAPERARDFGQGRDRGGDAAAPTDMSSLIRQQLAKRH